MKWAAQIAEFSASLILLAALGSCTSGNKSHMSAVLQMACEQQVWYFEKNGVLGSGEEIQKALEAESNIRFAPGDQLYFSWATQIPNTNPAARPIIASYVTSYGTKVEKTYELDIRR